MAVLGDLDAVILDTDGVITDTASVHAASWKELFDAFLHHRSGDDGYEPFSDDDYRRYVDGKPRFDGVRGFLESRGIELPDGTIDDEPGHDTVGALGNAKNALFLARLERQPPRSYPGTLTFLREARGAGIATAAISASKNARSVLDAAGVTDLFDVVVDGNDAAELGLAGKPDPAIFLEAARRLEVEPRRAAIVEDALSGVEAGRRGGFELVVGVDRTGHPEDLAGAGADVVVRDLDELEITGPSVPLTTLPHALDDLTELAERLGDRRPAVFLDYDGTLTPIVDDPAAALLPEPTRRAVRRLAKLCPVAIVSGRDRADVANLLDVDDMVVAGSHGFDITGPGWQHEYEPGAEARPALEAAADLLDAEVGSIPGAAVERKRYAIAVHFRRVDEDRVPEIDAAVQRAIEANPGLRRTTGKMIFELRPDLDWNKGTALTFLLDHLHLDQPDVLPIYVGDDDTDEDALQAIHHGGLGVIVGDEDRSTAAHLRLDNPGETMAFLNRLADLLEARAHTDRWVLRYEGFDPDNEGHREALCTLGNGYVATRGALPENAAGGPSYPGTYLAGVFNRLTSEVSGRQVENEDMVNAPNWLCQTWRPEGGQWFDLRVVEVLDHSIELDMRRGVLTRMSRVRDADGRTTRVTQRRLVSMADPHLLALETTLLPEDWSGRIELRSGLDGGVTNSGVERYRELANHHLSLVESHATDDEAYLQVETNQSRVRIAVAARTRISPNGAPDDVRIEPVDSGEMVGQCLTFDAVEGRSVTVDKVVVLHTSRDHAVNEIGLDVRAKAARAGYFDESLAPHVVAWAHVWNRLRIDAAVDASVAMNLDLHLFHLAQVVSRHSVEIDAGVPARGLHGEAYRGHIFWDEMFIIPLLSVRLPGLARGHLMYRYRRLGEARHAAREAGYSGAMFPWQSGSNGREETQTLHLNPKSGRWLPDGSHLQRHINAAVVYDVWKYYEATGDTDFMAFHGAELVLDIARFWSSAATYDKALDRYSIHGVMGPDEYHERYPDADEPGLSNNAYTNVMAVWCLGRALQLLDELAPRRVQELAESLSLTPDELDRWRDICRKMRVCIHDDGIISQFEGYEELDELDWDAYRAKYGDIHRLDRILEAEGDSPNRYKLAKQADVLMLFFLLSPAELREIFEQLGYVLDDDAMARNVDYYLARTAHGSTLSGVVHAWVLARTDRRRSWNYFLEALRSDVFDVQGGTTAEGIHLGAMAGTVDLLQHCYTGIETRDGVLWLDPALPAELDELSIDLRYRRRWVDLRFQNGDVTVSVQPSKLGPIKVGYRGEVHELAPGEQRTFTAA
jgi:alpha,alpha-trehalase